MCRFLHRSVKQVSYKETMDCLTPLQCSQMRICIKNACQNLSPGLKFCSLHLREQIYGILNVSILNETWYQSTNTQDDHQNHWIGFKLYHHFQEQKESTITISLTNIPWNHRCPRNQISMWHLIKQFTCINYTPTFHIRLDHRNAKILIKTKTHFRWDTKDHLSIYYITLKGGNNLVYYRKRETIICNTLDPCQKDPNQNGNLMIKLHAIGWGSSKVINTRMTWHCHGSGRTS